MAGLTKTRDIGKLLHNCRQRVHRVGIELEGGWGNNLPPGTRVIRDGSVDVKGYVAPKLPVEILSALDRGISLTEAQQKVVSEYGALTIMHIGEIPSAILTIPQMDAWVKTHFPIFVNKSCGLHIHMSFKDMLTYMRLMTPAYQDAMVEYLRRWGVKEGLPTTHHLFSRLRGESRYCKLNYFAQEQARIEGKNYNHDAAINRYTAINYSFGTHGTVECRLLPMFPTAEQSLRALKEVLAITNAFLVAQARREDKIIDAVVVEDDLAPLREEVTECV
jgi:hypothetical protein